MQLTGQLHQLPCPQCTAPMAHLTLAGHGDNARTTVPVDHCAPCRLVWFDALESVQLAGLGWIALLRELQQGLGDPLPAARATPLDCPLCRQRLKPVQNRTRFGRFPALECARCHGHLHSHAGVLAERGLVRPLLPADRQGLLTERRTLCCLNCGAPAEGRGEACRYCDSPLLMLDLPRLSQALRLGSERTGKGKGEDKAANKPLRPSPGALWAWACHGCGTALDPSRHSTCPQCGHAVLAPSLLDLTPLLDKLEAEWRAEIAARAPRPQHPSRRKQEWRDTGLAHLLHRLRPDEEERAALAWQAALGLGLLLAWWLLF